MKQIRRGVFETNSSSTHSITICTREEFEKFENGELVCDMWSEKLVPAASDGAEDCYTWDTLGGDCLETYVKEFTTPSGDSMVAFGTYGYDG